MQKKILELDCSAHPETLPAGPEDMRSRLTYVSLLKPASFEGSVLWSAGKKKKVLGCMFQHVSAHEGSSHVVVLVP